MKIKDWFKSNIYLLILTIVVGVYFAINVRMNVFSYGNFDFGKFDLGNMVQMLWNTQHGRFMYLTDYFGTNLPRWAMSHVDPILLLFLPIFILIPHALTLVFAQIALVLLSAYLIYALANLELKSKFISLMLALSYVFYPAIGYLTAKTGFHGVTVTIPFFLAMFLIGEKIYLDQKFTKVNTVFFWLMFLITLSGKEQIGLYTFVYGIFLLLFRLPQANKKPFVINSIAVSTVSLVWFVTAFFIIIPNFAQYRVVGYQKFASSLGIGGDNVRDVGLENYFLSRYDVFGDSYSSVIQGILLNPRLAVKVFFGGDKVDNFNMTFGPELYLPFASPAILAMAVPDLMANYLTSAGGIGTAEIQNHRISMIIPVIFISLVFVFLLIKKYTDKTHVLNGLAVLLLISNIYSSFKLENPVFMWAKGAIQKRIPVTVASAKTDQVLAKNSELKVGDVVRLSALEGKDRECAQKIVEQIPDSVSVSGPDYLGAHLAQRETYAIFPALYDQADYVIVDVFSKKILTILNVDTGLITDVINRILRDPNYKLEVGCGNLFVFKKVGSHNKATLLPIQERYTYSRKFDYPIYSGLSVVDFNLPKELNRGQTSNLQFVYFKKDPLSNYFLYMNFLNEKTGDIYQSANLSSFAILTPQDWKEDHYYIEDLEIVLPSYLGSGPYRVFIGMTNYVKTRALYLGEVEIK